MIDLRDILSVVDVRDHRTRSNECNICCPFCIERGESPDSRFRLGINVETGLAHCYNCHWSSAGLLHTARQLCRVLGVKYDLRHELASAHEEHVAQRPIAAPKPMALPEEYESFAHVNDSVGREALKYIESRGVTKTQIVRHKIGYAGSGPLGWRVIFPVVSTDQQIYGCVARAIRKDMVPKYLNTSGTKMLWGVSKKHDYAVITEGVLDALSVERALLGERVTACAQLGCSITDVQLAQLKGFERIVILPDWDAPGVEGAMSLAEACVGAGYNVFVSVPRVMDESDPGSKSEKEIRGLVASALAYGDSAKRRLRASLGRRG